MAFDLDDERECFRVEASTSTLITQQHKSCGWSRKTNYMRAGRCEIAWQYDET